MEEDLKLILKKQDKILNLLTKIAKTLYLIPANEKELETIRVTRENNLKNASNVYETSEKFKEEDTFKTFLDKDFSFGKNDIFSDVIGNDLLGGDN